MTDNTTFDQLPPKAHAKLQDDMLPCLGWLGFFPRFARRLYMIHVIHDRHSFSERSKYIPVRLTPEERTYLRLVESVVSVTDYTGKVDADFPSANKRQNLILTQVCTYY